jgi:hypothetical protein
MPSQIFIVLRSARSARLEGCSATLQLPGIVQ